MGTTFDGHGNRINSVNGALSVSLSGSSLEDRVIGIDKVLTRAQTPFDELLTASRYSENNFRPTWGISEFRDATTETGTGASVDENSGELRLQTGTSTSSVVEVQTIRRANYIPGTIGEVGVGMRFTAAPTGTQDVKWGYFDDDNGFGFGYDATDWYIFYRRGGSDTKVYRTEWNIDQVDGAGPSGVAVSTTSGTIWQIDFLWYGYGAVQFSVLEQETETGFTKKVPLHTYQVATTNSIIDPNQPITVRGTNGDSSTSNFTFYIGGRQISLVGGRDQVPQRRVSEILSTYTLVAAEDTWEPLIALRKKANHGPSGRANSVNVDFVGFEVAVTQDTEFRVTYGGTTSNLSWSAPTGWNSTESACETKVTSGTALTTSADGRPIQYALSFAGSSSGPGGNARNATGSRSSTEVSLASTTEVILWARKTTATAPEVSVIMSWIEEW